MFTFIAHMPPVSTNRIYIRPGGRFVLSPDARNYKSIVNETYEEQISNQLDDLKTLTKDDKLEWWIYVSIKWFNKDNSISKNDISNYEKIVTDTLIQSLNTAGIPIDDKQIFKLHMLKVNSEEFVTKIEFDVIK